MIVTVLLTNYIVCFRLIIYQTRVSHDLIITDNSYRSCLILPVDVVYMQVVMRQLRVWQLVPDRKIMYEGQYRDLVFYTSRIFEPGKRILSFFFFFFWGGGWGCGGGGGDIGSFY